MVKPTSILALFMMLMLALSCSSTDVHENAQANNQVTNSVNLDDLEKAYFASGCFWCVEAIFEHVEGVEEVVSGYSGGTKVNPTYQEISSGRLKHAEAVEVYYDPAIINYETLLVVFFDSHDPTTYNRQGPDAGPQYRSMIYFQNEEEKIAAEKYIQQLEASKIYSSPIVTEVVSFDVFYPAEDYHQDYERNNPNDSYVRAVSIPRLNRFKQKHPELLKKSH